MNVCAACGDNAWGEGLTYDDGIDCVECGRWFCDGCFDCDAGDRCAAHLQPGSRIHLGAWRVSGDTLASGQREDLQSGSGYEGGAT